MNQRSHTAGVILALWVGLRAPCCLATDPPPRLGARPSDAIQLLGPGVCDFVGMDGGPGNWRVRDGELTVTLREKMSDGNHLVSQSRFRDAWVHAEFWLPDGWTGNSGLYFHGLYELQILNSVGADSLSWKEMGSVYRFHKPRVNASKPPKQWQSYDARFVAPRRNADGQVTVPGRLDAWLNGVPVQINAEFHEPRSVYCPMLTAPTPYMARAKARLHETGEGPLILQEHLSPVRFRNIWVQKTDASDEPIAVSDAPTATLGLIGDSTVADTYGWGPALDSRIGERVEVLNYAKNGATLRALSPRLDELLRRSPDYVLVQFGHNDQKQYGPAEYERLLHSYITRIEASGSRAIVISPVTRRNFDEVGRISPKPWNQRAKPFKATLDRYATSARTVARETGSPFIDLYALSVEQCNALGPEGCASHNATTTDTTHFSPAGAAAVAALLLPELKRVAPDLLTLID